MDDSLEARSKFLAYVLRHAPESLGLQLDPEGWARVDDIVARAATARQPLTAAELVEAARSGRKQRFELSADAQRIRAIQGHSTPQVQRQLPSAVPPERLFHGTATRFAASIRQEGLRPGDRHHVHLSADPDTALQVGRRHGSPVVFVVHALRMHALGHVFHEAENGVWLTAAVPPDFLASADADGQP